MREVSEKDEFIALLDFRKRRFDELSAQPRSVKSPIVQPGAVASRPLTDSHLGLNEVCEQQARLLNAMQSLQLALQGLASPLPAAATPARTRAAASTRVATSSRGATRQRAEKRSPQTSAKKVRAEKQTRTPSPENNCLTPLLKGTSPTALQQHYSWEKMKLQESSTTPKFPQPAPKNDTTDFQLSPFSAKTVTNVSQTVTNLAATTTLIETPPNLMPRNPLIDVAWSPPAAAVPDAKPHRLLSPCARDVFGSNAAAT